MARTLSSRIIRDFVGQSINATSEFPLAYDGGLISRIRRTKWFATRGELALNKLNVNNPFIA
jgi:hypothetical protein